MTTTHLHITKVWNPEPLSNYCNLMLLTVNYVGNYCLPPVISINIHKFLFSEVHAPAARVAKIDLVTIFDCDYQWYCTIDYVKVNRIGIYHLLHHIQFFLSHQSSIAHNRSFFNMRWVLLSCKINHCLTCRRSRVQFPVREHFSVFLICNNKKGKTTQS